MACGMTACSSGASDDDAGRRAEAHTKGRESMTPERRQLLIAENELVATCMHKQGFKFIAYHPPESEVIPVGRGDDVESRRKNGYSAPRPGQDGAQGDPNAPYVQSLSTGERDRFDKALFGHDEKKIDIRLPDGSVINSNSDGCVSDARRALYGDLKNYLTVYTVTVNVRGEAGRLTVNDPEQVEIGRAHV
mgnify:CR=1 FL=1